MIRGLLTSLSIALAASAARAEPEILIIGDSLLAIHHHWGGGVGDHLADGLGVPVESRAEVGARFSGGRDVIGQYETGSWGTVILSGGANDLATECGCFLCDDETDALISPDGDGGEIMDLVDRIRADGAHVIYVAYPPPISRNPIFAGCSWRLDDLRDRLVVAADAREGFAWLDGAEVVPFTPEYYEDDGLHPSPLATQLLGQALAAMLKEPVDD